MQNNSKKLDFADLIEKKDFQKLPLHDFNAVQAFIVYLQNLDVQARNLKIIKNLIQNYGLPIIIHLKNFYSKLHKQHNILQASQKQWDQQNFDKITTKNCNGSFVTHELEKLKQLSSIARQACCGMEIQHINFIYKYGFSDFKVKRKVQKTDVDINFIKLVKELEDRNKDILNDTVNGQDSNKILLKQESYNQFYDQQLSKHQTQFSKLMIKCLLQIRKTQNLEVEVHNEMKWSKDRKQEQKSKDLDVGSVACMNQDMKMNLSTIKASKLNNQNKEPQKQRSFLDFSFVLSTQTANSSLVSIQQSAINQNMTLDFYSSPEMLSNHQKQLLLSDEDHTYKSKKKDEKQLQLPVRPLCCKTFFYQNQIIAKSELSIFFPLKPVKNHSEIEENNTFLSINSTLQFESVQFPFLNSVLIRLERSICSFLNGTGGTIFIGISSNPNQYKVDGLQISQAEKQVILRNFRMIGSKIQPDVMTHKLYNVEFVPLKNRNSNSFISGTFVVKIKVKYGNRNETYCIKDKDSFYDEFVFRSNNGSNSIIEGRRLLDIVKDRFYNPLLVPELLHPEPCQKPEIGSFTIESDNECLNSYKISSEESRKKNDTKNQLNYKQKSQILSKMSSHIEQKCFSPQPLMQEPPKKTTVAHNQQLNKKTKQEYSKINDLMQNKKEPTAMVEGYFYVIGLTQKQLQPILAKKNICNAVIEQVQQHLKLVVKAFDEETKQKIHKLLKKIQSKYGNNNIYYHQLSLKVRVQRFKEALAQLKNLSCQYETDEKNKVFKFNLFRESLRSWLYLKGCGIQGNFIK